MVISGLAELSEAHLRRIRGLSREAFSGNFFSPGEKNKKRLYLQPLRLVPLRFRVANGEMAEWSIAAVLKTVVRATGPGVRIPLSPQTTALPSA